MHYSYLFCFISYLIFFFFFFFFNDTATTEIYTLSLHDALPILRRFRAEKQRIFCWHSSFELASLDRKSTRLNSSHSQISYAVFCLKKKKKKKKKLLEIKINKHNKK